MGNAKNCDGVAFVDIRNYIRQTAEDQFARPFYTAWPSDAGMRGQDFGASNDLEHGVDRGLRIVTSGERVWLAAVSLKPPQGLFLPSAAPTR